MPIPTVTYVDILSPSDMRVRKWWIYCVYLILFCFLMNFFTLLETTSDTHVRSATVILVSYAIVTFKIFLSSLTLYIPYHCGYKYPGTKWLAFMLISIPFAVLKEVRLFQVNAMAAANNPSADPDVLYGDAIGVIVMVCLYSVWVVMCWRLRKVNKKVQRYMKSQEQKSEQRAEHLPFEISTESQSLVHA